MAEVRLGALRVVEPAADPATVRRAHDHGTRVLTGRAPPHLRQLGDDLIERGVDEVDELDLRDRAHALERHPDRSADDPVLRERSVGDAVLPELGLQAFGDAEHAAVLADVFAEQDHVGIRAQRDAQRVLNRLDHGHLRHRDSPRAGG